MNNIVLIGTIEDKKSQLGKFYMRKQFPEYIFLKSGDT